MICWIHIFASQAVRFSTVNSNFEVKMSIGIFVHIAGSFFSRYSYFTNNITRLHLVAGFDTDRFRIEV